MKQKLILKILKGVGVHRAIITLHRFLYQLENEYLYGFQGVHKTALLGGKIEVTDPGKFYLGKGSVLHANTYLETGGGLFIGEHVHAGTGLTIYTSEHDYQSEESIPYGKVHKTKAVHIEDFVWLGANVCILPGITIGEGAIIGMGSVVAKDIPRYAVAVGNPAKTIKYRNKELFERLKSEGKVF
jgi:acetyltransferase-like isoleucine patch superfamily enzyme